MQKQTKTKISRSLKRHYKTTKSRKDVKSVIGFILTVVIVSQLWYLLRPIPTSSALYEHNATFPVAGEKQNGGVWQEVDKALRDNKALDLYESIHCTIYNESVKVCGINNPFCNNAHNNNPVGSIDRGVCMYNSYWRSDVSDHVAYNPYLCATQMIRDFLAGKQNQWYGYCDNLI